MKKTLLTLAVLALTLTSVQASVVINSTNFPDENLRQQLLDRYDDGDGVVTTGSGVGDVVIYGIAPETRNFKRTEVSYELHIDLNGSGGVNALDIQMVINVAAATD